MKKSPRVGEAAEALLFGELLPLQTQWLNGLGTLRHLGRHLLVSVIGPFLGRQLNRYPSLYQTLLSVSKGFQYFCRAFVCAPPSYDANDYNHWHFDTDDRCREEFLSRWKSLSSDVRRKVALAALRPEANVRRPLFFILPLTWPPSKDDELLVLVGSKLVLQNDPDKGLLMTSSVFRLAAYDTADSKYVHLLAWSALIALTASTNFALSGHFVSQALLLLDNPSRQHVVYAKRALFLIGTRIVQLSQALQECAVAGGEELEELQSLLVIIFDHLRTSQRPGTILSCLANLSEIPLELADRICQDFGSNSIVMATLLEIMWKMTLAGKSVLLFRGILLSALSTRNPSICLDPHLMKLVSRYGADLEATARQLLLRHAASVWRRMYSVNIGFAAIDRIPLFQGPWPIMLMLLECMEPCDLVSRAKEHLRTSRK